MAWAARAAFIYLMPPVFSYDVNHWSEVADALAHGQNPYSVTDYLNWPPLWMQVTWAIGRLSDAAQLPFARILQLVLILIESAVIVALFRLIRLLAPAANIRGLLLAGISLNPVAILLVCQHGNFDVLVGLWVVLFTTQLVLFQRSEDSVEWLVACLFLGLAVLTKTVPLVLAPLLAQGARGLPPKTRWLGAALVLGPVILGMSVIYVLDPNGVTHKVIAYRSIGGYFGISGLSARWGIPQAGMWWAAAFPWVLLGSLVWIGRRLWQQTPLAGRDLLLLPAMLLAAVPALGPGYAPQYMYWYLPLLVTSVACYGGAWRKLLIGFYAVAALTYLVEYGLFGSHGMFLVRLLPSDPLISLWARQWSTPQGQTVVRVPLFLGFVALLVGGAFLLRRRFSIPNTEATESLASRLEVRSMRGAYGKRALVFLLSAAIVWLLLAGVRPGLRAGDGLVGQYYGNAEWAGSPLRSGADPAPSTAQMDRRWAGAAPAAFSAVWTGYLTVGRAGSYNFATTSDDGSWLYIDDQLVVDNGGSHASETRSGQIHLAQGSHRVRLRYVQFGGSSGLTWSWARDGGPYSPVPSWALSRRRAGFGTVVAARIIDMGTSGTAALIVLVVASYVGVRVAPALVGAAGAVATSATARYRSGASLVFSVFAYCAILFLPRADGGLYRAVTTTTRDLNVTAVAMVRRFEAFQRDIGTPRAGEQQVIPDTVLAMLALLDRHGLNRYQMSDGISVNAWDFQQMVASAWPRTFEADAKARFVLDGETVLPECAVVDRQREVSLVYCP